MRVEYLESLDPATPLEADLVIVGGGAAGLTVAREFFGAAARVLILESGVLKEEPRFDALNAVESCGEPTTKAQFDKRVEFHGGSSASWSADAQAFGVRCRVLGGSTAAWAGKSAPFDDIDFASRPWVPFSGWPFGGETLTPYMERAGAVLNLGPFHGDGMWKAMGVSAPQPEFDHDLLQSFFWQFARSRLDRMDIMRFGPEFLTFEAPNVRVVLNATVTRIDTNPLGTAFEGLELSTVEGVRHKVRAKACVLAASGVENPRLLLASNQVHAAGLGNRHGAVGRYLMDHPSVRLGRFGAKEAAPVSKRFGFYGLRHRDRTHMYMHGLAPSEALQRREHLLNSAVYMLEERAPDDPWDALKRLISRRSEQPLSDLTAIASGLGLLVKGGGMKLFESNAVPKWFKDRVVDAMVAHHPNFVVREYQSRGLPHKLNGLLLDGISEQAPNPDSRITLSERTDALGVPLARVDWRIDQDARRTLMRLGQLVKAQFPSAGLPEPELEDWIMANRPDDAVIIDMGHTLGATRMSADPKTGVVDAQCRVREVAGLYIAGGSVIPTSGHANPTLMILALAIRLADQIKADLSQKVQTAA